MGVTGLYTYLNDNKADYFEVKPLSDFSQKTAYVDGLNSFHFIKQVFGSNYLHVVGEREDEIAENTRRFVELLRANGMRVVFVLEHGYGPLKAKTQADRVNEELANTIKFCTRLQELEKKELVLAEKSFKDLLQAEVGDAGLALKDPLAMEVFKSELRRLMAEQIIEIRDCDGEADAILAGMARENNGIVLSSDTDFYAFGCDVVPLLADYWNLDESTCHFLGHQRFVEVMYGKSVEALATALEGTLTETEIRHRIQPDDLHRLLPDYATLLGNDYFRDPPLIKKISTRVTSDKILTFSLTDAESLAQFLLASKMQGRDMVDSDGALKRWVIEGTLRRGLSVEDCIQDYLQARNQYNLHSIQTSLPPQQQQPVVVRLHKLALVQALGFKEYGILENLRILRHHLHFTKGGHPDKIIIENWDGNNPPRLTTEKLTLKRIQICDDEYGGAQFGANPNRIDLLVQLVAPSKERGPSENKLKIRCRKLSRSQDYASRGVLTLIGLALRLVVMASGSKGKIREEPAFESLCWGIAKQLRDIDGQADDDGIEFLEVNADAGVNKARLKVLQYQLVYNLCLKEVIKMNEVCGKPLKLPDDCFRTMRLTSRYSQRFVDGEPEEEIESFGDAIHGLSAKP